MAAASGGCCTSGWTRKRCSHGAILSYESAQSVWQLPERLSGTLFRGRWTDVGRSVLTLLVVCCQTLVYNAARTASFSGAVPAFGASGTHTRFARNDIVIRHSQDFWPTSCCILPESLQNHLRAFCLARRSTQQRWMCCFGITRTVVRCRTTRD